MIRIYGHISLVLLSLSLHLSLLPLTSAMTPMFTLSRLLTTTGTPSNPPYGIPPSDFAHAISSANNNPISNASFPVSGYNTSTPAGPNVATGEGIPGWRLNIDVAANVPLINATDFFLSADVKKTKVTEVMTLSLVPPPPPASDEKLPLDENSWRICAVVFTGGLSDDTVKEAQLRGGKLDDGTCDMYLPSECIQGLQVNSVANNTAGKGESGCGSLVVPDACGKSFVVKVGDGYEINSTSFDQINGNQRYSFFAGASAPTGKDNATAVMVMEQMVWPVVITWTHFSTSGEVHDSAGWLSCITAPKVTNPDWKTATNGGGAGREKSMWALIVALVLTGAVITC